MQVTFKITELNERTLVKVYLGGDLVGRLWVSSRQLTVLDDMLSEGAFQTKHYFKIEEVEDGEI